MPILKPEYFVEVHVYGCAFDIRANDVPIFANPEGRGGALEIPLNNWIRPGRNVLSWALGPMGRERRIDSGASCEAIVFVRPMNPTRDDRQEVARLQYLPAAPSDPSASIARNEKAFDAEVPFAASRWFSAAVIGDTKGAYAQVLIELRRLHSLLKDRRIDEVMAFMAIKNEELAQSIYMTREQRSRDARREIERCFARNMELLPLEEDRARFSLVGGGRLAAMTRPDGRSILRFREREGTLSAAISAYFCRSAEQGWIWIR